MEQSPASRFWSLIRQYKYEVRHIYFYAILIGIVNLTLPLGIQAIINFLQVGQFSTSWAILVIFVLVGILLSGIFQLIQLKVVETIQMDLIAKSAFDFAFRLPKIRLENLDKIHAPELVNRFFDNLTIQKGIPKILIDFSLAGFQLIFGLILLAIYSPYFIILGFFLILFLYVIIRVTSPKGLQTSLEESKYKYNLAHWLEEIARTNRVFKTNVNSNFHLQKTDNIVFNYLKARGKHFKILLTQFRFFIFFKVFVAAGLLIQGSYLVFDGRMNIGQFVAAEIIIILIINSIEKFMRTIDTIYDVLTALEKIGFVTDLSLDKNLGKLSFNPEQGIAVKAENISFKFPEENEYIIQNLNFNLEANNCVLLEGGTGSGKTILNQVLAGIYSLNSGRIFFNDIPYKNISEQDFYANVGINLPTNQIFEGSIKENICIGNEFDDAKLNETIKALGLETFINTLDQGLETMLDSGGRRLPRGIIQKILIARLLISEPKLLLLEDPFIYIEENEQKKLIDYFCDPARKWTLLVISQNKYWQQKANKILEL